jgi:putative IMPACT (imprinted ancient) family translation regulator
VLVVVTRHFGGIKLGAGGLARAYGGSASECLRNATAREIRERAILEVRASFDDIGAIYPLLERFDATKHDEDYGEGGVALRIEIDEGAIADFEAALADATRGRARCQRPAE